MNFRLIDNQIHFNADGFTKLMYHSFCFKCKDIFGTEYQTLGMLNEVKLHHDRCKLGTEITEKADYPRVISLQYDPNISE